MDYVQYLVFETSTNKIAINLEYVLEVIRMPKWTKYPNSSDNVKGIFNLRDKVIPLIDFRKLLGYNSIEEETNDLIVLLKQREQDHINWINELLASIAEQREFKLTTDPHKCKFGQWYYSFQTNNFMLKAFLDEFEKPHKFIHEIGYTVNNLIKEKKYEEAEQIAAATRDKQLKLMLNLFRELYKIIKNSMIEFVVIVDMGSGIKSFTVDKINRIINVNAEDINKLEESQFNGIAQEVIKKENELILKLDIESLLKEF